MIDCPVEDRLALHDLVVAHAHGVDSLRDLDGLCAIFAADAVLDMSDIGYGSVAGQADIRTFYAGVFDAVAAQAHYLTNIAVTDYAGDTASVRAYVTAMARYKAGGGVTAHVRYRFDMVRNGTNWLVKRLAMDFLIPPDA